MESSALNHQLIESIHAAPGMFCLAVTGGGSSALSSLLNVSGASNTVLEAYVPYHAASMRSYLGSRSSAPCNTHTARALAMTGFQRAKKMQVDGPIFGLGCTSALTTNRERKGADRCHIAIQGQRFTRTLDLDLDKSTARNEQEAACANAIVQLMAECLELDNDLESIQSASIKSQTATAVWQDLITGRSKCSSNSQYQGIFPGAFNPLHDGHRQMLDHATKLLGEPLALEISVRNVDKAPLDYLTMQERLDGALGFELVYTDAPTFVEKSALFPGTTFIVGTDTVIRIAEARYYTNEAARDQAIADMQERGNSFLVFGRQLNDKFQTLSDIELLPKLKSLCTEVSAQEFRADISSSAIRSGPQ